MQLLPLLIYVCLIQEHWLLLSLLDFDSNFSSCGVSGMDDGLVLSGRPFGGCAIVFRKSLLKHVKVVRVNAKRFCAVKLVSSPATTLLVHVCLLTY